MTTYIHKMASKLEIEMIKEGPNEILSMKTSFENTKSFSLKRKWRGNDNIILKISTEIQFGILKHELEKKRRLFGDRTWAYVRHLFGDRTHAIKIGDN